MTELRTMVPRSFHERAAAARGMLASHSQLWLATGGAGHGAHLIPVSYVWDGTRLTMATFVRSRAAANLRANPMARLAIGQTADLTMVDGDVMLLDVADLEQTTAEAYAQVSHDPRAMPGFVYLRMVPTRIQVWNGFHEYSGRTVMLDGQWLTDPVD